MYLDFAAPVDHTVKLKDSERKMSAWTLLKNWKNMEH